MLSVPDLAIVSALALILFGPDQLPKVARKVGHVMRDVQNTSQAFLREIERAADEHEPEADHHPETTPYDYAHDGYRYEPGTNGENALSEVAASGNVVSEAAASGTAGAASEGPASEGNVSGPASGEPPANSEAHAAEPGGQHGPHGLP